jgi:glutamyl-tRNA synthetase
MDHHALAELLYPHVTQNIADWESAYPPRILPEGARVTRFAPSPTGFMHLGGLYGSLLDERLAANGGVFYLRIEDTDLERKVEGGVDQILGALADFGLAYGEGPLPGGGEKGAYGPYCQSERRDIYHAFAKHLVQLGHAYPCFCTKEQLAAMRQTQQARKVNFGYYGVYAVHRGASLHAIQSALNAATPWVLRLRSQGDHSRRFQKPDILRGMMELPENDQDMVLLKSDGLPTYHFAHLVDDYLMRTTHVVRAEEWLPTFPVHHELFERFGFEPPQYLHTPQIMKLDGGSKRKLSKRLDPEASVQYYLEEGYPTEAVLWYLMSILNSGFEDWMARRPGANWRDYPFSISNIGASGALFDPAKIHDVCKNVMAGYTANEVFVGLLNWSSVYRPDFAELVRKYPDPVRAALAIGRGGPKPRKDIARYSELPGYLSFLFDETFTATDEMPSCMTNDLWIQCVSRFCESYDPADGSDVWFEKVKAAAAAIGFAPDTKDYKKDPAAWPGHVGDVSMALRVAVTGRRQSPDLCEIMRVLGAGRVMQRLRAACPSAATAG